MQPATSAARAEARRAQQQPSTAQPPGFRGRAALQVRPACRRHTPQRLLFSMLLARLRLVPSLYARRARQAAAGASCYCLFPVLRQGKGHSHCWQPGSLAAVQPAALCCRLMHAEAERERLSSRVKDLQAHGVQQVEAARQAERARQDMLPALRRSHHQPARQPFAIASPLAGCHQPPRPTQPPTQPPTPMGPLLQAAGGAGPSGRAHEACGACAAH